MTRRSGEARGSGAACGHQTPAPVPLRSAGGVVMAGEGEHLRIAVMRSAYGTWVFPKGGIEEDESLEEAARREVAEEIGLSSVEPRGHLGYTEHEFEREGIRYRKRVDWFLFAASCDARLRPDQGHNVLDCGWFSPQQALALLTHLNQRRMLRRALAAAASGGGAPRPG